MSEVSYKHSLQAESR